MAIVQKAAKVALDTVRVNFSDEFAKLKKDPSKKKEFEDAARASAQEQIDHGEALALVATTQSDKNLASYVAKKLGELLPSDRVQKIETGLQIPTYRLNFRFEKGNYYADITKSGEKYLDSVKLDTAENFATVTALQIASIVVESIALVLSIVGVAVPEETIAKVATKLATEIAQSPAIQKAVAVLKKVYANGGAASAKAKAIWELIKAVWEERENGELLIKIVKMLDDDLSYVEKLKIAGEVIAMITAAVATDGVALVAKIVLALNSAYEFTKKILNLHELDEIRADVKV